MNNILKIFSFIFITSIIWSCDDEKTFIEPDIELVKVYSISNIEGPNLPIKINVYTTKDFVIEYTSVVNTKKYNSSNFADNSNDNNFDFSVNKMADNTITTYAVTANKQTGIGTITVNGSAPYNISIKEDEIYN